jgi:hypothetical protein
LVGLITNPTCGSLNPPKINTENLAPTSQAFSWGGKFHKLPNNYVLPNGNIVIGFQIFCCGDASKMICPLIETEPSDYSNINQRKRFSDLKFLMSKLIENLKENKKWHANPTIFEANEMIKEAMPCLGLENSKRRLIQMSWTSAVTTLRKKAKKDEQEKEKGEDEDSINIKEDDEEDEEDVWSDAF